MFRCYSEHYPFLKELPSLGDFKKMYFSKFKLTGFAILFALLISANNGLYIVFRQFFTSTEVKPDQGSIL